MVHFLSCYKGGPCPFLMFIPVLLEVVSVCDHSRSHILRVVAVQKFAWDERLTSDVPATQVRASGSLPGQMQPVARSLRLQIETCGRASLVFCECWA